MRARLSILALMLFACACSSMSFSNGSRDAGIRLRVVDKSTGAPQPGAEIYFLDLSKYDVREWQSLGMMRWSPDDLREWFCARTTADFRGEAHVPRSPDVHGIEARFEDRMCAIDIDPTEQNIVIARLDRAHVKRAIVVDEHGAPAGGVPLVLYSPDPPPPEHARDRAMALVAQESGQILWSGRSRESDGRVEIERWQNIEDEAGANARIRLCALADFVTESGLAVDADFGGELPGIDARTDESEPLTLTVPSTGSVIVDVKRADGSPAPDRTLVQLLTRPNGFVRESDDEPVDGFWSEDRFVENGRVIFPAVCIGRTLGVSAWSSDGSRRASAWIDGPRAAHDGVHVELALGERLPTLTGRLVDEHGAPLPWAVFDVRWSGADADVRVTDLEPVTDSAGRFRLDVVDMPPRGDRPLELEFELDTAATTLATRVRFTQSLVPGDFEFGDLELRADESSAASTRAR